MTSPCPIPLLWPEPRPGACQPIRRWLLRGPEVARVVGLSANRIAEMIRAGDFPRNLPIGPAARAWVSDEVAAWWHDRHKVAPPLLGTLEPPAACHDRGLDRAALRALLGVSPRMARALTLSGAFRRLPTDCPKSGLWSLLSIELWLGGLMIARATNRFHAVPLMTAWPVQPRLIDRREVEAITGLHTNQLYVLMGTGRFPASGELTPPRGSARGWDSDAVDRWLAGETDAAPVLRYG